LNHLGRKVAGERSARLGVAVLRSNQHRSALRRRRKKSQQRRRRAYHQVDRGEFVRTFDDSAELRGSV
jgi:hypothetical protein